MFSIQRLPQNIGGLSQQCRRTITSSSPKLAERFADPLANVFDKPDSPRTSRTPQRYEPPPSTVRRTVRAPPSAAQIGQRAQNLLSATASSKTLEDAQKSKDIQDMSKQITRRWRAGDVYAPHDLTGVEMSKWKKVHQKGRPKKDAFDVLRLNPLDLYKNFTVMSEYVTEMGRIKPRSETGLRPVNQRKVAKAIRRAIGIGLMPSVHKHPELLRKDFYQNHTQ
ncbi:hypothetical protein MBLNU457_2263t1 [Dothideomycetes sp. NU457]